MPTVRVNHKAANRLASGHPWVFSSDILDKGDATGGEAVSVFDPKGRLLGTAHYSSTSQIALRFLSGTHVATDRAFFLERLTRALAFRRQVVHGSDAYRLVHAEADLLPGLIVDVYGDYGVVQTLTQGMDRAKDVIASGLIELLGLRGLVERNDAAVRDRESLPRQKGVLAGDTPDSVVVSFNGIQWSVDLLEGQKTAVYLDQRENYLASARYARGTALDCFTGTGGFALHLARVCDRVHAVDSSERALATAQSNAARNRIDNIEFKQSDVFDLLTSYTAGKRHFDTIVLDPPAFAKSRSAVEAAARGYKDINQRALRLLESGGILISCSCSHHFSEAMLLEIVAQAALDTGKTLRVRERRTQAQDHPILLTVQETHYLKCLVFEVL